MIGLDEIRETISQSLRKPKTTAQFCNPRPLLSQPSRSSASCTKILSPWRSRRGTLSKRAKCQIKTFPSRLSAFYGIPGCKICKVPWRVAVTVVRKECYLDTGKRASLICIFHTPVIK